jgi:chromosome segregation ATPase
MTGRWLELDAVLRERLRDVLQEPPRPVTEAELRSLLEEGRACMLILSAELDRLERRLAELDGDPQASFSSITDAFRRVSEFRTHVEELRELLSALESRAREVRAAWQRQVVDRA